MDDFIIWCNNNEGFANMLLSIIGAVLSIIAIIVSIKTARLPYKKSLLISSSYNYEVSQLIVSSKVIMSLYSISVTVTNIGNRNVNISYLGMSFTDNKYRRKKQNMFKTKEEMTGTGMLQPGEVHTNQYKIPDIVYVLNDLSPNTKIYACAQDTEGKSYYKCIGKAKRLLTIINEDRNGE